MPKLEAQHQPSYSERTSTYHQETKPPCQRPLSASFATSSYVINRPATVESGSGHVYLSARRCISRIQRRSVSHFQRGTQRYRLTLARVGDHDDLDVTREDSWSQFIPTIYVDSKTKTQPIPCKELKRRTECFQNPAELTIAKEAVAIPPITASSTFKTDVTDLPTRTCVELKDNDDPEPQQKSSALFFKRRYVFLPGQKTKSPEEFDLSSRKESDEDPDKLSLSSINPHCSISPEASSSNQKLDRVLCNENWSKVETNEKEKINMALDLVADNSSCEKKEEEKPVINCINFFYTVQQPNDDSKSKVGDEEEAEPKLLKKVVQTCPKQQVVESCLKQQQIVEEVVSRDGGVTDELPNISDISEKSSTSTVIQTSDEIASSNTESSQLATEAVSSGTSTHNLSAESESEKLLHCEVYTKQQVEDVTTVKEVRVQEQCETNSKDQPPLFHQKRAISREKSFIRSESTISNPTDESVGVYQTSGLQTTSDQRPPSSPNSSMRTASSKFPQKKNKVKFDLDLEIHVVPREVIPKTSSSSSQELTDGEEIGGKCEKVLTSSYKPEVQVIDSEKQQRNVECNEATETEISSDQEHKVLTKEIKASPFKVITRDTSASYRRSSRSSSRMSHQRKMNKLRADQSRACSLSSSEPQFPARPTTAHHHAIRAHNRKIIESDKSSTTTLADGLTSKSCSFMDEDDMATFSDCSRSTYDSNSKASDKMPSLQSSYTTLRSASCSSTKNKQLLLERQDSLPKLVESSVKFDFAHAPAISSHEHETSSMSSSDHRMRATSAETVRITCVNGKRQWRQKIVLDKKSFRSRDLEASRKKQLKDSEMRTESSDPYSTVTSIISTENSTSSLPSFTVTNVYRKRSSRKGSSSNNSQRSSTTEAATTTKDDTMSTDVVKEKSNEDEVVLCERKATSWRPNRSRSSSSSSFLTMTTFSLAYLNENRKDEPLDDSDSFSIPQRVESRNVPESSRLRRDLQPNQVHMTRRSRDKKLC